MSHEYDALVERIAGPQTEHVAELAARIASAVALPVETSGEPSP